MSLRAVLTSFAVGLLSAAGCTERVTQDDVDVARKKAEREGQEAIVARGQSPDKQIEENSEARQAQTNLRETEAKAAETIRRDEYVATVEAKVTAADQRIDALEATAKSQSGATKDATDRQITDIKDRRNRLKDGLSTLKSADLLEWQKQRPNVDRLMEELNTAIR